MSNLSNLLLKIITEIDILIDKGDNNSVVPYLKKLDSIVNAFPDNPDVFFCYGMTLASLGKNNLAIKKYNRAIEINSKDPLFFYSRGLSNEILGITENAISDYENAVKLNPKDFNSYFRMGTLEAIKNKDYLISRGYFREAIKLNPNDKEANNNLKISTERIEKYKKISGQKEYNFN